MKKALILVAAALVSIPLSAIAEPHPSLSNSLSGSTPLRFFQSPSSSFSRFNRGYQTNQNRFGLRGRNFNKGLNNRSHPRFNRSNRSSVSGRFNNSGGGFIQFPGQSSNFGRRFSNYPPPSLTISRKQLQFQRFLEERAQRKREILGKKESTLDLNRDILYGPLGSRTRPGFGARLNTPFSFRASPTDKQTISEKQQLDISKAKLKKPKPQGWNPRRLKKTNPTRGVISSIPMTSRQKARLNF
ncbi:MAG: hypothetical protein G3M70_04255 [Candidatus Nitronauta litoralis]|uniref:Uncharacterized protein n=1 Tax=Candidatus Nitronauta litoralis TaxID=2705533 RepID=A0A7T0FZG0_9BACT|nr:MAG: hypothetical protein G3M70_04255 [Candidatus Nitronauta litoralis]